MKIFGIVRMAVAAVMCLNLGGCGATFGSLIDLIQWDMQRTAAQAAAKARIDAMGPDRDQYFGTKIDPANVSQITNGVTTQSQVEALFGPPQNVSMMDDGGRMMTYIYFSYLTSDRHTLQITLDSANVVQNHEYNMNAVLTRTRGGWEYRGVNYPDEKK